MNWLKIKMKYFKSFVSNDDFIRFLNDSGVQCGKHTKFFDIKNVFVDTQRPWMLEIGDYCKITRGVVILQHDYSRSVLRRVYGEVIDGAKQTKIGDNVFIGMNSIILMGSNIGDNVIIAAGSIVSGTIPNNCVAAGVPAKPVCSLEEYYLKRKARYVEEAKDCARVFAQKNGRAPSIEEMGAFFPIYLYRDVSELKRNGIFTNLSGDDEQEIIDAWLKSEPIYADYDIFLKECGIER